MLSLRRALFDRLLHLPLPKLWDMKTGGILSRLTGDVDTTTGLMQMAIVSPAISVIRLVIAIGVLMSLNWRLALTALAIIPGVMLMSFARRGASARSIARCERMWRRSTAAWRDFSGIRVVRAFRREVRELLDYMRGRHMVLRKEMFAQRREMVIWTSWGLLLGGVNVVIVWYGGYLNLRGRASIGDIMAFQWYTFLLLNPVGILSIRSPSCSGRSPRWSASSRCSAWRRTSPTGRTRVDAPRDRARVPIRHVEFEYREVRPVVIDFNVSVPVDRSSRWSDAAARARRR